MRLTGGEIIVKQLVKEGVPYIIGIPGHGVLGLFDGIRKEERDGKIKYIQVKHEQAATSIADGYYRVSGKPLATFASIGPGTLNTTIGLGTSYVDSTAFLMLCGDTHVRMKGVGVLQEVERYADSNILRSIEPLSKRSWRAESAIQLPKIIHRAFNQMLSGRPGPCSITLPMDVQADYTFAQLMSPEKSRAEGHPCADKQSIERSVALMNDAKRPVILVGGGALRAKISDKILKLAEKWGAAIVTTLAAKGAVPETHPLYCFHTGSKGTPVGLSICSAADVILALGTRFADETTCSYRKGVSFNFPNTKLIHVDIDPSEIGKNYGADVGIIADVEDVCDKLITSKLSRSDDRMAYFQEISELKGNWKQYKQKNREVKTEEITISQMIGIMNEKLPENTIIATSSGNTQAQLFQEYEYKIPYCNLTTGGFSTMGWALPAAMGAKLASPSSPVVAFLGDGDFMMVMQELSTMVQYNIPIIIILADNSGWMAIKDLQMDALGKDYAFGNDFLKDNKPYSPDFYEIGKAFGALAYRADTQKDLSLAIEDAVKQNKPTIIVSKVSREYPYTGGKAFGWWDVPIPAYMEERREEYEKNIKEETL